MAGPSLKELLIFGYSRKILDESTMNLYPLDILNEIKQIYLNIILFRWDKVHHGDGIYFETKDDDTHKSHPCSTLRGQGQPKRSMLILQ